jgi:hypothetical protein
LDCNSVGVVNSSIVLKSGSSYAISVDSLMIELRRCDVVFGYCWK